MIGNVLIKTTAATAIDCTHIESVTKILIDSAEPENTQTKYLLSVDGGKWRKFFNGAWDFAEEQELTAESILSEGNTKAELQALTADNLTAFAGKIINFAVAISVGNNADLPSINKIELVGNNSQIKKEIYYSKVFKLADESVGITDIDIAKTEESGGAVNIFASVKNDSDDWSNFVSVDKVSKQSKAIRFKAEVEVERPGISTAALNKIKIRHWQSGKSVAAEGKTILLTKPYTLENNLNRAHAVIKFPKSADTNFKVYVVFGGAENSFGKRQHSKFLQR